MKLSDLLFHGGGFRESAYGKEAELIRREITPGGELVKTQNIAVSPERALSGEADSDISLKEYDLLVVRQIPDWAEKIQVTLSGEVRFPGTYAARKGERLSSIIGRAGGFTSDAYLKAAQFTRVSTQKAQQEAIDKLIEDLELEVAQKAQATTALDKEDIEANRELINARRGLIAQLRKARAKGRVVIRIASVEKLKGSSADILLEDGDRLDVPKKMNVVNVVGRVYNPTGVVYDPANDRLGYYLRTVGGPTESADRDHIFMIKANGSVVTRENAEGGFFVFGESGLMSAKVEPGDSIVVPEKLIDPLSDRRHRRRADRGVLMATMAERPPMEYREDEIDLGIYFAIIRKVWWKVALLSLSVGIVTLLYMFTMPNIYRATAIITPSTDEKKQNPALGALASFGIDVGGPTKVEDLETLFNSDDLTVRVFGKYHPWPILLADQFDPSTGKVKIAWIDRLFGKDNEAKAPGDWDAIRAAKSRLKVSVNKKASTVSISFESPSADGSANIVKYYLDEGKSRLQEEALDRAIKNNKFIEEQIRKTVDTLTRDRLYSLYGQEVEREMMARNREQFGFRVIDSPRAPDRKTGPGRGRAAAAATVFSGVILSIYFISRDRRRQKKGQDS
jgi:uncharacterized protein involved in exopolysaccharide biosynthesis